MGTIVARIWIRSKSLQKLVSVDVGLMHGLNLKALTFYGATITDSDLSARDLE